MAYELKRLLELDVLSFFKLFPRKFYNVIRFNPSSFKRGPIPGVESHHRQTQHKVVPHLEPGSSKDLTGRLGPHDSGQFVFLRKGGDGFGRACRVLVYEQDYAVMERLRSEALRNHDDGFIAPGETEQEREQLDFFDGILPNRGNFSRSYPFAARFCVKL